MSGIRYAVPFHGRGTNGNNGNFGYINGGRHQLSNYANANANMQSIYANKQNFVFGNGGLGLLALLAALGVTLVALSNKEKKETVVQTIKGLDGKNGIDGKDGKDGKDGVDAVAKAEAKAEAEVVIEEKKEEVENPPVTTTGSKPPLRTGRATD